MARIKRIRNLLNGKIKFIKKYFKKELHSKERGLYLHPLKRLTDSKIP